MSLLQTIMWRVAKRAAADPRVQRAALNAAAKVNEKMDQAAEKAVQVTATDSPMREAGRMLGSFFGRSDDKR
jgi:hypothetical protein